jgi:mono/diheme cytochrome c family protein
MSDALRLSIVLMAMLVTGGCERARQDMYDQPKLKPFAATDQFADGSASRSPLPGTEAAAIGPFAGTSSGRIGTSAARDRAALIDATQAPPPTLQRLQRGRERYEIYCTPCHSVAGDGDGLVVRRGFPSPPSFHTDRLRAAPDRYLFDVITQGHGVMPPYAGQIAPDDRWAIVSYVRVLQLSQHVQADKLAPAARARLDAASGSGS